MNLKMIKASHPLEKPRVWLWAAHFSLLLWVNLSSSAQAAHISEEGGAVLGGALLGFGLGALLAIACLIGLKMHWLARIGAGLVVWFVAVMLGGFSAGVIYKMGGLRKSYPPVQNAPVSPPAQPVPAPNPAPSPPPSPAPSLAPSNAALDPAAKAAVIQAIIAGGGSEPNFVPPVVRSKPETTKTITKTTTQTPETSETRSSYRPLAGDHPTLTNEGKLRPREWEQARDAWKLQHYDQPIHRRDIHFEASPLRQRLALGTVEPFVFALPLRDFEQQYFGEIVTSGIALLHPQSYVAAMRRFADLVALKQASTSGMFGYCALTEWPLMYQNPEDRINATAAIAADKATFCR